jgi:hypothetical protein
MHSRFCVLSLALLSGCMPSKTATPKRAEIQEVGATSVKFIPAEGQPPYCLIFTVSDRGVVRQLTMNRDNTAVPCEAGKPVANATFRIPLEEGRVRAHIVFSDRKLDANPMAIQIHDLAAENPKFMALDLRAPGSVVIETLEYTPSLEAEGITVQANGALHDDARSPPAAPSAAASAAPVAPTKP